MKNIVLLTSAVYTNYGIYDSTQRIQQTLDTARSAKKYIPGAVIILIDNSKVDVQNDSSAEFEELVDLVDYYIDNSDDADIKYFHENVQNYDIGKNAMEALGIMKALTYVSNDKDMMKEVESARKDVEKLQTKIASHDLKLIASEKAELLEKKINRATNDVMRCFEIATGDAILPDEKNNQCSDLLARP